MKKNENVIWQENKVSYEDRCRVLGQQGKVVWFTGLSGSGKSTIAVELEVYVNTDLQTCMERDPKGLYKKQIKNFTGKDSGYEEPLVPELIADTKKYTAKECAEQIFDYIMM